MLIALDATVLQQPATGIAKATLGLYKAGLAADPGFQAIALHRRPLVAQLPDGVRDLSFWRMLPQRYWRAFAIPTAVLLQRATAVHFPWNGNVPRLSNNITVVTTLHDVLPLEIPGYFPSDKARQTYHTAKQRDIERSHLLITDSEYSKRQIITQFRIEHEPLVIYPGPSLTPSPSPPQQATSEGAYFLYVGGYDPRKGLETLLHLALELWQQGRLTTRLILVGDRNYYSSSFRDLVSAGVAAGAVEERGYVPDDELADLYSKAVALVYPSKYEGFGMPPLEAMALGCPVLTTRYTSLPEICGDAALYIEPDNGPEFAAALVRLQEDATLRAGLQACGQRRAATFRWERAAEKFLSGITDIIQRRSKHNS